MWENDRKTLMICERLVDSKQRMAHWCLVRRTHNIPTGMLRRPVNAVRMLPARLWSLRYYLMDSSIDPEDGVPGILPVIGISTGL